MNRIVAIILIAFLAGIDQLSKYLVEKHLTLHQSESIIPLISFFRTYNEGIAFSWLNFIDNQILIFLIFAIIAFVFWLWRQLKTGRILSSVGFAIILAGATGNLIDRIFRGHVVDFIQFHTSNWSFAIFNLADSFITIGAVLIIIDEVKMARAPIQE